MQYLKYAVIPIILGIIIISCEKDDSTVIDPILTFPAIDSVHIVPNSFDTIAIRSVLIAFVHSQEQIASVNAKVKNPRGSELADVQLKDDGILPDSTAGDGAYTGLLDITLDCKLVGGYNVEFTAFNVSGIPSNTVGENINVINANNNRPSVNYVISPDSMRRPSGTGADSVAVGFLQAWPTDPDGVCDVKDMYFYSFRPDGSATNNGNPFYLNDVGNLGLCDSVAYNGKFSLCIRIVNNPLDPLYTGPPQLGNYRFRYFAKDYGNLESDSLVKFINVFP